jgi:hypothetical protein
VASPGLASVHYRDPETPHLGQTENCEPKNTVGLSPIELSDGLFDRI